MMVLQIVKWDIHPDKLEGYAAWVKTALPRLIAVPGLVEFRAFRPVAGTSHIVTTYEFDNLEAWTAWYADEVVQKLINERRAFTMNESSELWGPSPVAPAPIRPGNVTP